MTSEYTSIIADKDAEIAALRSEITSLKERLAVLEPSLEENLEELVIADDSVTDSSNITLKVPEDEGEDANVDPTNQPIDMSNLMQFMSMLMQSSQQEADGEAEGDGEAECESEAGVECEAEAEGDGEA